MRKSRGRTLILMILVFALCLGACNSMPQLSTDPSESQNPETPSASTGTTNGPGDPSTEPTDGPTEPSTGNTQGGTQVSTGGATTGTGSGAGTPTGSTTGTGSGAGAPTGSTTGTGSGSNSGTPTGSTTGTTSPTVPVEGDCTCGSNSASASEHLASCEGAVDAWVDWTSATTLPKVSGYYKLTQNVTVTQLVTVTDAEAYIYLDLNGKTVTVNVNGQSDIKFNVAYKLDNTAGTKKLTILDSSTGRTGKVVLGEKAAAVYVLATTSAVKNTLVINGGTFVGSKNSVNSHGGIFRAYGVSARINLNSGTLQGAVMSGSHSGGCVVVDGGAVFTMNGGTLTGGSGVNGGNLLANADSYLYLYGGRITGGTASSRGGNVFVSNNALAVISGNVKIFDGTAKGTGAYQNKSGNIWFNTANSLCSSYDSVSEEKTPYYVDSGNVYMTGVTGEYGIAGNLGSGNGVYLTAGAALVPATYKVNHYTKDSGASDYILANTQTLNGYVGKDTEAAPLTSYLSAGYTAHTFRQATVREDGATVVNIYYSRETAAPKVLQVGFGKGDITPTEPVATGNGMSTSIQGRLEVRAIAFRDEQDNLYIHLVTDLSWGGIADPGTAVSYGVCDMTRNVLQTQLGIDPAYVTVAGTHNHSQVSYSAQDEATARWRNNILLPQIVSAVQQALADLAPAEMYIARTETENLTFVRRYWLKDGTFYDGYTSNRDSEIARHETEADEEIQLVKFVRQGKKDILIVNWQTHATTAGDKGTMITPDFVGPLRDQVEEDTGVLCVFSQGACGNLAPGSRISSENVITGSGWSKSVKLGKAVAAYVKDVFDTGSFTMVQTGLIQMERIIVPGKTDKGDQHLYDDALKVIEFSKTASNNYETAAYAAQFGIETIYHAKSIVEKKNLASVKSYELNIITIGDVAFTTLPMEFFDTTGKQIKEGSPFEMTILLGYSCSKGQYVADIEAWEHGGYESYKTYYQKGTAEEAVGHYLTALNRFYPTRLG